MTEERKISGKNYRTIIDRALDLCDPEDPDDLASMIEGLAGTLRRAGENNRTAQAKRKFDQQLSPWFTEEPKP